MRIKIIFGLVKPGVLTVILLSTILKFSAQVLVKLSMPNSTWAQFHRLQCQHGHKHITINANQSNGQGLISSYLRAFFSSKRATSQSCKRAHLFLKQILSKCYNFDSFFAASHILSGCQFHNTPMGPPM